MGGLRRFNTCHSDLALKIQWVKAFFEDVEIEILANHCVNNKMGALIWRWNLIENHANVMVKKGFWADVF